MCSERRPHYLIVWQWRLSETGIVSLSVHLLLIIILLIIICIIIIIIINNIIIIFFFSPLSSRPEACKF